MSIGIAYKVCIIFEKRTEKRVDMIYLEDVRKRMIASIKESGISQSELARLLNIKQPTVAQYLSGRAMPALDTFANLCIILDVDSNYILGIDSERAIDTNPNSLPDS